MARNKVVTDQIVCDYSGKELDEGDAVHRSFAWEGKNYELDLHPDHAEDLDSALQNYGYATGRINDFASKVKPVTAKRGRPAGKAPAVKKVTATPRKAAPKADVKLATDGGKTDPVKVREWARAHGVAVSERGRIAGSVLAKYHAAVV
jgi:hypothetical protein